MMTPSRVKSAGGAANYYGKDDYYVTGEAGAPGIQWGGEGAKALGLEGLARTEDFHAVLQGKNPNAEGPGLSSATKDKHHPGWDFTFTVPKSVSLAIVAAERSDPALAERLQAHVLAANDTMMKYLEANHAFTRVRGEGGVIREVQTKNLVYASVLHRTTRGGDPHFHVHNPTANTTLNPETGAWGALETKHIYKWQQVASLVGARDLQARFMAEGFNVERKGELKWEIAGVDPALLKEFSSRSAEIDVGEAKLAADRGVELTKRQRDMVQKQTRKDKRAYDREALADNWLDRAAQIGGTGLGGILERGAEVGRDVTTMLHGKVDARLAALNKTFRDLTGANRREAIFAARGAEPDKQARELVSFGVAVVEEQSAVNSKHLAMLHALRASPAGVTYDRLERGLQRLTSEGHVRTADRSMAGGITTQRTIEAEQAIVAAVDRGRGDIQPILKGDVSGTVRSSPTGSKLNDDQLQAAGGFFSSRDRYRAIPGFAGVGKTFAFAAVREVAEAHGQQVYGLSSFNTHVQEFRKGSGIQAQSVASWLQSVERAISENGPDLQRMREHSKKLHLIIDEASTLTNDSAHRITKAVDALGIRSVTIAGDQGQTGGPGAGNAFKLVLDREIQQHPIKTILRQRNADEHFREGVRDLAEGRLKQGMGRLAPNVHALGAEATNVDLARHAVGFWAERRAAGAETLLITATNEMRALQSLMARDVLKEEGALAREGETRERFSPRHMTKVERFRASSYQLGDTLVFNEAFKGRGPARSERATVIGIDAENNILKLKGGPGGPTHVDLNKEQARGYASFGAYSLGTHEVSAGERLVWEVRFKDRGYERGAEFTVKTMGKNAWTIVHGDGREERIRSNDVALSFTSYAYAMTTERAQGKSVEAPVFTLPSTAGAAVAETKNYVNWSRLTRVGDMVTDDAPKVLRMLAQNDGQKLVALDHVRELWDAAREKLKKDDPTKAGQESKPLEKDPERQLERDKLFEPPAREQTLEHEKNRSAALQRSRNGPGFSI